MKNQLFNAQFIFFSLLLTLFSKNILADAPPKLIAFACYSCHGDNLATLKLNHPLSEQHLSTTLLAFKYDKKKTTVMDRITKGFSDSELISVAHFLSELN